MQEYFIFQDENSQKFWNISTDGANMKVAYGRLGTKGQESEKQFDSPESCEKEAQKLIKAKLKNGYKPSSKDDVENSKEESRRFGYTYDQWEAGKTQEDLCNSILSYKGFANLRHITIANWKEPYEEDCQVIIDFIVEHKDQFAHVESFTFGDMDYEECELSWIKQANYNSIWTLPNLKHIHIQGSEGLALGEIVSNSLQSIEIKCGGLPLELLQAVEKAKAPSLEKCNLYMGVDNYGCNCSKVDVEQFLQNSQFPHLKYLGLCNSEMAFDITEAILACKYAAQIETLDLSMSVFRDNSAQLILDNLEKLPALKLLNLEYHFLSKEMMKKLSKLPFAVNVKDQQESDGDNACYDSPMFTE